MEAGLVTLSVAIVLAAIIGGSLYGCERANQHFYAAQKQCIDAGGSFVPTDGLYTAACVGSIGKASR